MNAADSTFSPHAALCERFADFKDSAPLDLERQALVWHVVFDYFVISSAAFDSVPDGAKLRREFKRDLLQLLFREFPAICATEKSLANRFAEKFAAWLANGKCPQAIKDRRENSGRVARPLCPQCRPLVIGGAVDLDGDLSQAWRRLQLDKKLCPVCAGIGAFDVRRAKSEVPKSVRRDVTPDIDKAVPWRRGPKYIRLISPYILRNPDDIGPGDWFEADDVTPNHIVHGQVEILAWGDRKDGRFIGRMEVLVLIDRRTDYPIAYLIILGDPTYLDVGQRKATYNSAHCRLLFLRGHDQIGLPHKGGGFYLENSIWASRLINGPDVRHWRHSPFYRTESGLLDPRLGLDVKHAEPGNPRSKVIERMLETIQNRQRCQPGFVGFNERLDKREVMQDVIRRVKNGKEHPGNLVPSVEEFRKLLDAEFMAFAAEPQNGRWLPGVSPMEAFHNGIGGHPGIKSKRFRQLGDTARFLMSSHERTETVGPQGIKFRIDGRDFVFWGPELEPYRGRKILARFNFEEPELLSCQPPDGEPFTVRERVLPSTTATQRQLTEAKRDRASWMRQGKVLYDSLPHPFRSNIVRLSDQTEETHAAGRLHNEEMEKFREEKAEERRALSRNKRLAGTLNVSVSAASRNAERVRQGLELEAEIAAAEKEGEA